MLNPFELHTGSIIKANKRNGGKVMSVKEILRHNIQEQRMVVLNWDGEGMNYEFLKDCEGVRFTDDILQRLGFTKAWLDKDNETEGYYFHMPLSENKFCDLAFITGDKNGIMEVCLFPYTDDFRVQYVHELQNWFSALKKEAMVFSSAQNTHDNPAIGKSSA